VFSIRRLVRVVGPVELMGRLEQLVVDVSASTGISVDNVLLFLPDGRDLKDEVLLEMYERGGEGGQSEVSLPFHPASCEGS
jgi:hypothetical protein